MSWSPASGRKELEQDLRLIGSLPDSEISIAEAALLLAALDRPRVSLSRYHHHLSLLARDTRDFADRHGAADSLEARVAALNDVILGRYEYQGDHQTYDNLQNANLMRVIDRRKGLPVALGILYLHSARAQGWQADGIGFPGHFLLRMEHQGARLILDPFNKGTVLQVSDLRGMIKTLAGQEAELEPGFTEAVSNREILLRLQNNLKVRLIEDHRPDEALEVIESMLMFAPGHAGLWREAGLLHGHLENLGAAVMALENFLALSTDSLAKHEAAGYLQKIKAQLN